MSVMDNKKSVALVLLDLSAAFDVIDHELLLDRLSYSFGVTDTALSWMKSYLTDRYQKVGVGNDSSDYISLSCGVPQGSVLGPRLYCLFSRPLGEICRRHKMNYHCYADDTQLYLQFDGDWEAVSARLEMCLNDICSWMNLNMLMLNRDKTEFIVFNTRTTRSGGDVSLKVGDASVSASDCVKNLGVYVDTTLSMERQVNAIVSSCHYTIRKISYLRPYITTGAAKTLTQALVLSRLDYCNSLLFNIPKYLISKLQRVQNTAARLITRCSLRDHITPTIISLGWLTVEQRIKYKLLTLVYKCLAGSSPHYLEELVQRYTPGRSLRSSRGSRIVVPTVNGVRYGGRRFDAAAADLWNDLPSRVKDARSLQSFKRLLKHHLLAEMQ